MPDERSVRSQEPPTPAFMRIEGRIVHPLPPEREDGRGWKWSVQPWILVAIVVAIMLALMLPGLLLDLRRQF